MAGRNKMKQVAAHPYHWPFDGNLAPENTALLIIDMQADFCSKGGYIDVKGFDIAHARACITPIQAVLSAMRSKGFFIVYTREGHRTDLSDLPVNKRWRSQRDGIGIGDKGPLGRILVRGEPGWQIVPELEPHANEPVVDKPGKGSFFGTDLQLLLHNKGIRNIVFVGVTTDVCVNTTIREANDRGFECLLLEDCCAATDITSHVAAINGIKTQGGLFGVVAKSSDLLKVINCVG